VACLSPALAADWEIVCPQYDKNPQIAFGVGQIIAAVQRQGHAVPVINTDSEEPLPMLYIGLAEEDAFDWRLSESEQLLPHESESYLIAGDSNTLWVIGRDSTGAMYGAMDVAEQIGMLPSPLDFIRIQPKAISPFLRLRGVNPFIHVQALEDRNSWFFDDSFWQGYLDQLALSRHNFLDFHACYDLVTTGFPNIYPYLLKIDKYPDIGLDSRTADRNLKQFAKVVKMAKDRGIKVGLMGYGATWDIPGLKTRQPASDDELADYTALCVKKLIENAPELEFLGFRVGESGKRADFYQNSYLKGLKLAGREDVKLYTRSWVVPKRNIELIADGYPGDMYIEIKYNGEQLGMPYQVSGGWMAQKASYSYQSYSDYRGRLR
jgi:hypothetical protein